jgi:hypothetical protein
MLSTNKIIFVDGAEIERFSTKQICINAARSLSTERMRPHELQKSSNYCWAALDKKSLSFLQTHILANVLSFCRAQFQVAHERGKPTPLFTPTLKHALNFTEAAAYGFHCLLITLLTTIILIILDEKNGMCPLSVVALCLRLSVHSLKSRVLPANPAYQEPALFAHCTMELLICTTAF